MHYLHFSSVKLQRLPAKWCLTIILHANEFVEIRISQTYVCICIYICIYIHSVASVPNKCSSFNPYSLHNKELTKLAYKQLDEHQNSGGDFRHWQHDSSVSCGKLSREWCNVKLNNLICFTLKATLKHTHIHLQTQMRVIMHADLWRA